MNAVLAVLESAVMRHVGWAVLHSIWQGALIGLGFLGLRQALRRASARARYLAGCLSLAGLLAAPALTVLLGWAGAGGGSPSASYGLGRPDRSARLLVPGTGAGSYFGGGTVLAGPDGAGFLARLAPGLAVGWVAGVLVFSVRLARGWRQVRDIRARHCEAVDPSWMLVLDDLRDRLGVSRPVRLVKSALVQVPTVVGWLRPVILLPAAALTGLTPAQMEAILAHELAHVRRWDYLVNAFQCMVETLLFYHPVAWWISGCIREERENCCDDLVVEVCGDRVGYARALANLEGLRAESPGWAFAASGGSLVGRIRRLLGLGNEHGAITVREVSGLALLAVGLVLIILGIRTILTPATYQSAARIRVERDPSDISRPIEQRGGVPYDPYFIQTEFEVIQSEVVLTKVIELLDLNREWGKKHRGGERLKTMETLALLRGSLDLRTVRNTSLIEIQVHGDNAEEPARIANAIAEAYRGYRLESRMEKSKGGIRALEERFAEQEAKIQEAEKRVDELGRRLRIADPVTVGATTGSGGESAPGSPLTADSLRRLEALRIENKAEFVKQTTLLEQLQRLERELGPSGVAQTFPTLVPDALTAELLDRLAVAEQQLSSVTKEYGAQHAEVVKVKSQIEDLHRKIKERVDGILTGLQAKVVTLSNTLDNLNREVQDVGKRDVERANATRPYYEAKRNLEELQRFREVLGTRIANERTELSLPTAPLVEIVDRAVPALRQSAPDTPRGAGMIGIGLLMDIVGLLLLTRPPGFASRPPNR